jgi:hypothetical protein
VAKFKKYLATKVLSSNCYWKKFKIKLNFNMVSLALTKENTILGWDTKHRKIDQKLILTF